MDEVTVYQPPTDPETTIQMAKDPTCVRLLFVTDPHCSPYDPPAWKTSYHTIVMNTLDQLTRFAVKQNVDAMLWGGDIFHLKAATRNPVWFLADVIDHFAKLQQGHGIPNLGIGGNHDYKFGHLGALKGQPLEILVNAGLYQLLDHQEQFIEAGDFSVRLAGGSYHHSRAEHVRDKKRRGANHLIALGHFWFGPDTGEVFGEPIFGPQFLTQSEVDVYLIGHHHEDQGAAVHGKTWICSAGAISKTGSHRNDLTRRPSAVYLEVTKAGIDLKIIRPKFPDINDLIDLKKKEQLMTEQKEMDDFIKGLAQAEVTEKDPMAMVAELTDRLEVRRRAEEYLKQAEAET